MSGTERPRTTVRPSTAAAASATTVEKTYIATMSRPWTGISPKARLGGKSAPMINV
jgi:hypothetical protein